MVNVPIGNVVLRVRSCSELIKEYKEKKYAFVQLEDADGYYFTKLIDHVVPKGSYIQYKVHSYKGDMSLQYVKEVDFVE